MAYTIVAVTSGVLGFFIGTLFMSFACEGDGNGVSDLRKMDGKEGK